MLAASDERALVPVIESAARHGIPVDAHRFRRQTGVLCLSFVLHRQLSRRRDGCAPHGLRFWTKRATLRSSVSCPAAPRPVAGKKGFKETVAKSFNMQIGRLPVRHVRFRAKSLAVTEDILTANPNLNGIFAPNESSSIGASQAVKMRGLGGKVKIVAFDASSSLIADLQGRRYRFSGGSEPLRDGLRRRAHSL